MPLLGPPRRRWPLELRQLERYSSNIPLLDVQPNTNSGISKNPISRRGRGHRGAEILGGLAGAAIKDVRSRFQVSAPDTLPGPGQVPPGRTVPAVPFRPAGVASTAPQGRSRHEHDVQVESNLSRPDGMGEARGVGKAAGPVREFIQIDPRTLRLPPGRVDGADPGKLARQISRHGRSIDGLPPPLVVRGKNGELQLIDGVTRATRVGKLLPGQPITIEVIETRPKLDLSRYPTVGEKLP
jgi:hypothetical protein